MAQHIDAVASLEAVRAVLATVNGNSEPYAMADALARLDVIASGKPDPGRSAPDSDERRSLTEDRYSVEGPDADGRFWSYSDGIDFSPNRGHASEADAWAACRHDRDN